MSDIRFNRWLHQSGTGGVSQDSSGNIGIGSTQPLSALDLGTGNIRSHNIHSTGIVTTTGLDINGNADISGNLNIGGVLTYEDVTNIDSVGIITAQSDVSIADKIIHTGDTNTAIRFPAADTFTVETAGSERVRVTSAGKVGIGSEIPATKLDVAGQANFKNNGSSVKIESSPGTNFTQLQLTNTGGSFYVGRENSAGNWFGTGSNYASVLRSDGAYPLIFRVNGANRLRITSGGEIYVGGSSTYNVIANNLNTAKLHLSGAGGGSANIELYGSNHTTPKMMTVSTNNTERLRIDSSGRLGINDGSRLASDANEGAQLRVTGVPITRNQYYSPGGNYYGSFGYTDNTYAKSWIAVDSSYAKSSAVSAGIFLSAFHQDAGGSGCGFTIKNLRNGNPLVISSVVTAASVNNPAVETERLRIASDGSTYRGGTVITESDMNWAHDTYQRPHIFSGQVGGNPSDGAIVLASPETNPSNTRIGALVYGCKTSSTSGVSNSGLKAAIECYSNTNVSDAWKTGGHLRFHVRPDNANLTEALRINSTGSVTKSLQPGFYARRSTAGDGRGAGAQEWTISGVASYNTGSHFNTSNGRFTAPVAGKYIFIAQPGYKQTSHNFNFYFKINNSIANEPVRIVDGGDDLTSHSGFTGSVIFNLAVNDYVDIYINNTHHANTTYNCFTGYLLG